MVAIGILMDTEMPLHIRYKIKAIVMTFDNVIKVKDLKTRQSGTCLFIQMTIVMNKDLTLSQAHQISDEIESELHHTFSDCEIIIHLEPDSK